MTTDVEVDQVRCQEAQHKARSRSDVCLRSAAAAALWIFGTLVLATASGDSDLQEGLFPPCSATVAPEGPCEREGDGCPLVVNLPPMTVNLPKELMDLERLVEELQMLVTPDPSGSSAQVLCDMEESGGGWTVLQRRHDGSVSFNRSWAEYRDGFGSLDGGEFWLGNNLIHLLTRNRSMELRVELEDFEGVREYAQYELFKVASERMRYRLTVDGYSGTAGDALRFNTKYNHNNRAFTTPDRDNDRYPSGNCGAYYSSGWWFDACMAANLNGRYYKGRYKGVRDGIYWGTWPNIATEYYPTNERLSFKTVRMMIRPRGFEP